MLEEFKAFINRGNVLDLAVAVIIGAAFGAIVTSLTEDLLMPVIAAVTGSPDFSNLFVRLGPVPAGYAGAADDYAALKAAGVPMLGYGAFLTKLLNFLIIAFAVFLLVKQANRLMPRKEEAPPAEPADVVLLREIRDLLKEQRS
ncbi:large conductance mechanosensitive channel protein MscL [Thermaurantiacus tibetensis]|uniref:large conductance mechanosensitive channel protein MscL n=1 Tax=Thermaurantiacus tibetensis TaxID=2759035 RepID=UPI00188DCB1A|nr:large conductance mechanosensitive channel protein MscL [Thermaurantiacus tibetensis]